MLRQIKSLASSPDNTIQFRLGSYDRLRELVIDPVFSFSTYLAATSSDHPTAVTTDSSGNIYVTGYTGPGFPIEDGLQPTIVGSEDAFVAKLDPTMVDNPLIYPSADMVKRFFDFVPLAPDEEQKWNALFQTLLGH